MSYEAWGEPPEREPQVCPHCGMEEYNWTCEVCIATKRLEKAKELLRRALRQLEKWQTYYGDVEKLPPSGDIQLAEDAKNFLAHNASLSGGASAPSDSKR